jgi:hypothetical protein
MGLDAGKLYQMSQDLQPVANCPEIITINGYEFKIQF